jgi:osmotically-inducible protein OsmY
MNHRDRDEHRDQQGRQGGRDTGRQRNEEGRSQQDDQRFARGLRDTYNPEPQWLRQDRENRTWGGQRDDEDSNIGGSQYGAREYGGTDYGYGGSGRGSYAGSGREWGENVQGYGRQGAETNRDFGGRDYGDRDQPRMREERDYQQRTLGGASGGRSTQSGRAGTQSRESAQDYRSGYETSGWDDELDTGENQRRYQQPFRVGTGMGLGSTGGGGGGDIGREREFGQSYGSSSGYGSRSGWDLGTHQRDTGSEQARQSFRGMGPSNYKRSDERIREEIYERLTDSHEIDARSVMVEVNQGNVTLTGTVVERRMRYAAEDLVERIGGVSNINNQLRVQSQAQAGSQPQSQSSEKTQQEDKHH